MSFLKKIEAASKEAPHGTVFKYEGTTYKKGMTDQPTWMPVKKGPGLNVVIPSEDEENWDKIEKAYADEQKKLKEKAPKAKEKKALPPEVEKKLQGLQLQLMKAPKAGKKAIQDKIDALLA